MTFVYSEFRAIAGNLMRQERAAHLLQPTALVHEAAMRLLDAFMDFNRDGSFGPGEHVFATQPLLAGTNFLGYTVPESVIEFRRADDRAVFRHIERASTEDSAFRESSRFHPSDELRVEQAGHFGIAKPPAKSAGFAVANELSVAIIDTINSAETATGLLLCWKRKPRLAACCEQGTRQLALSCSLPIRCRRSAFGVRFIFQRSPALCRRRCR